MAESVVKIRIDSQEYDAKLKKAGEALNKYFDTVKKGGGTLEQLDDGVLEAVQSIGKMETASNSARGRIGEMTKAFTELQFRYQQFTDAEKQAPIGKEMAKSLETLKGRIRDDKEQLDDINKSISGGGGLSGAIDNLTGKLGVSIQSLVGWGTAISAAKVALDVAKDAFFASEATVDEWGRIMDSSKSLYEGFLTALNTGDISGYLSRIDEIVSAARTAYNELDRLGTMKTIQAPKMSAQQTENERMRMMIMTGRYIAPIDGRKASMQNGQLLTPDQIKRLEQNLQGGMQKVVTLVGNEVKQTGKAIDAVYNRQSKELGMSLKEFRKGTSSMAEFDKRIAGYDQYQKWRAEHTTIDLQSGRETVARGNPYEQFAKWGTFRVDGERYNNLVKLIQQRDQQAAQAYGMQSQSYRTMNRAEGITLRKIMGGGAASSGGTATKAEVEAVSGSIDEQAKKVADLQKAWRAAATDSAREDYRKQIEKAQFALDKLTGKTSGIPGMNYGLGNLAGKYGSGLFQEPLFKMAFDPNSLFNGKPYDPNDEGMKAYVEAKYNETKKDWKLDDKTIKSVAEYYDKKTEKTTASLTKEVGNIASGIGGIFNGIESLGVELPQGMKDVLNGIQGVVSILTSISTIVTAIQALTAADTIIPFSRGGVVRAASGYTVPGNYGYDAVPALLSSGEVVLNRAQTSNLASQLSDNGGGGRGYTPSHVSGEQIWIALNAFTRRTGKGELVTWR